MKKLFLILFLLSLIFFAFSNSIYAFDKPYINARSVILIDANTGRILYEKDAYSKMPMASITKLMTAVVAIEESKNDTVKISKKPQSISGSKIGVYEGQEINFDELVKGTLIRSGNDGAIALAEHTAGSVDDFVKMMNQKAEDLGMYSSSFANPHGLDAYNHYSTAFDLSILSRYALNKSLINESVKTKKAVLSFNTVYTTNHLLRLYKYCDGIKTGYTGGAGWCLAASATKDDMRLIAVVLGSPSKNERYKTCISLFEYGFYNYKNYTMCEENEYAGTITVLNGKEDYAVLRYKNDITIPLTSEERKNVKKIYNIKKEIEAPVVKEQEAGFVSYVINDITVGITPVYIDKDIEYKFSLGNVIKKFFNNIF